MPGVLVAAAVHAPIGAPAGIPVPLGFLSFHQSVVERAMHLVAERLGAYRMSDALYNGLIGDLGPSTSVREDAAGSANTQTVTYPKTGQSDD